MQPDSNELSRYNEWRQNQGMQPLPEKSPKRQAQFSLSQKAIEGLDELARSYRFYHGDHGNISLLLEAIGQGIIQLEAPN